MTTTIECGQRMQEEIERLRARVAELEGEQELALSLAEQAELERDALDHQLQRARADYSWAVNGARRMRAQRDAWRAATGCKYMTPEEAGARLDQIEKELEAERDALQRRVDEALALYRNTGRWDARPARILRGEGEGSDG